MGKKHLETVIGSRSYKDYYINGKIDPWTEEKTSQWNSKRWTTMCIVLSVDINVNY